MIKINENDEVHIDETTSLDANIDVWKLFTPVTIYETITLKPSEVEDEDEDEEEEEEDREEEKSSGLALKVSTPSLSVEIAISSEKADRVLIKEVVEVFERILKTGRRFNIL